MSNFLIDMNSNNFLRKFLNQKDKDIITEPNIVSQGIQYLLLMHIFKEIKPINNPPIAIEFGVINIDLNNNINALISKMNFKGVFFDVANENIERCLYKEYITSDNICQIFNKYNIPEKPEVVSIDIDSCDLWVMDAMLQKYKPIVICIEYNGTFPKEYAITMKNINNFYYNGQRAFGASPKAIKLVGDKYNYSMVYVLHDAFLIHNDYLKKMIIPSFTSLGQGIVGFRNSFHMPCLSGREKILIDYEKYIETNGDIEKSEKSAIDIVSKYCSYKPLLDHNILLNNWDQRYNFNEIPLNYKKEVCANMNEFKIYNLEQINHKFIINQKSSIEVVFKFNQYYIQYHYYNKLWDNNIYELKGLFTGIDCNDIDISISYIKPNNITQIRKDIKVNNSIIIIKELELWLNKDINDNLIKYYSDYYGLKIIINNKSDNNKEVILNNLNFNKK